MIPLVDLAVTKLAGDTLGTHYIYNRDRGECHHSYLVTMGTGFFFLFLGIFHIGSWLPLSEVEQRGYWEDSEQESSQRWACGRGIGKNILGDTTASARWTPDQAAPVLPLLSE